MCDLLFVVRREAQPVFYWITQPSLSYLCTILNTDLQLVHSCIGQHDQRIAGISVSPQCFSSSRILSRHSAVDASRPRARFSNPAPLHQVDSGSSDAGDYGNPSYPLQHSVGRPSSHRMLHHRKCHSDNTVQAKQQRSFFLRFLAPFFL